jgi:hypothetical protein
MRRASLKRRGRGTRFGGKTSLGNGGKINGALERYGALKRYGSLQQQHQLNSIAVAAEQQLHGFVWFVLHAIHNTII